MEQYKRAIPVHNTFLHASDAGDPYGYKPSVAAAVAAAVIFALASGYLAFLYVRLRSWFCWAMIVGVLMESIGFIARIISAGDSTNGDAFLTSFLMILLGPSFLAAACYTTFSRIIWFSCPPAHLTFRTLWVAPRFITPIFVSLDLLSFLIQVIGSSKISQTYEANAGLDTMQRTEIKATSGRSVLVVGLVLQALCFAVFAVIAARYFAIRKRWQEEDLGDGWIWKRLGTVVVGASTLITLRAIYRVIEMPHDKNGGPKYLQDNEWCFWVFDALPILAALVLFIFFHPGAYLPRAYTAFYLNKSTAIQQKEDLVFPLSPDVPYFTPEDIELQGRKRAEERELRRPPAARIQD